jgi:hypothetical protein
MNEHGPDYLWDRSGTPDPAIAELERKLEVLRHRDTTLVLPRRRATLRAYRTWLAAAAMLVLVVGAAWIAMQWRGGAWGVQHVAGRPSIDGQAVTSTATIRKGEWLETDAVSRARVSVGQIGRVDVGPNSRVQLVEARGTEHRLSLERGTIHAQIWAPPKFFFVNTPSATAIDLGCAYTLQVDDSGAGLLRVTNGWVGFERDGRESYVPEGAMCATRPDVGPGTPYYEDAPSGYGEALAILDFASPSDPRRADAFTLIVDGARRRDALTLWHLLTRGTPEERARVFDRLSSLAPPPAGVTRERVLAGDRDALQQWWDALGVHVSTWWRFLKKKW